MPDSEWTIGTLKAYYDALLASNDQRYAQRFAAQEQAIASALSSQEKAVAAALAAADRAVAKAEMASEKRFESVNEFRNTLKDQQSGLVSRTEVESEIRAFRIMIDELKARINRNEGRGAGLQAGWGILIGAVGLIAAVIAIVYRFIG